MKTPPWLALALLAFAVRAGVAILTEHKPIFPSHYYNDARSADSHGSEVAAAWAAGRAHEPSGSPSQRLHAVYLGSLYRAFGHRPLIPKLINCAAAGATIALLYGLFTALFGPGPALASALLVALWPSHIFFTSQNFKESATQLLATFAIASAALAGKAARGRLLAGGLALAGVGFLRTLTMLVGELALGLAALVAMRARDGRARALLTVAALALLHLPLRQYLFRGPLAVSAERSGDPSHETSLIPSSYDHRTQARFSPLSPRGFSEFRRLRLEADQDYARRSGLRVESQLFPDERFETWLDVALFVPKASFYALFMPLPGLYPLDGKPGRIAAAAENALLLALTVAAALGLRRGPLDSPRALLLLFFLGMAAASGLGELDLGGAARHKTLYLPFVLPFAFYGLAKRR